MKVLLYVDVHIFIIEKFGIFYRMMLVQLLSKDLFVVDYINVIPLCTWFEGKKTDRLQIRHNPLTKCHAESTLPRF